MSTVAAIPDVIMGQTVLTLAVRLVVVAAGLVSSIATARFLGPEGRGLFFFWSTTAALIVQFGNFGLHASNIYLHARKGVDAATLSANSLAAALIGGALFSLAVMGALALKGYAGANDVALASAVVLLSVSGLYILLGSNLLIAMGRVTEFNVLELLTRLGLLGVLLVVVAAQQDPKRLLLAIGIASMVSAAAVFWRLMRLAPLKPPAWAVVRQGFSYGLRAYVVACLAALSARMNVFLLEPALEASDYGTWSVAAQIFDVMSLVPASIALVLLPKVMRSERPGDIIRASALAAGFSMAALVVAFLVTGKLFIVLLYGEAFEPAFGYVLWGAPGLMALALIAIFSQYMASVGLPRALIGLWLIVVVLQGTMAALLIPSYGAAGAMASQSMAYLTGLVLMYALIRQLKDKHA